MADVDERKHAVSLSITVDPPLPHSAVSTDGSPPSSTRSTLAAPARSSPRTEALRNARGLCLSLNAVDKAGMAYQLGCLMALVQLGKLHRVEHIASNGMGSILALFWMHALYRDSLPENSPHRRYTRTCVTSQHWDEFHTVAAGRSHGFDPRGLFRTDVADAAFDRHFKRAVVDFLETDQETETISEHAWKPWTWRQSWCQWILEHLQNKSLRHLEAALVYCSSWTRMNEDQTHVGVFSLHAYDAADDALTVLITDRQPPQNHKQTLAGPQLGIVPCFEPLCLSDADREDSVAVRVPSPPPRLTRTVPNILSFVLKSVHDIPQNESDIGHAVSSASAVDPLLYLTHQCYYERTRHVRHGLSISELVLIFDAYTHSRTWSDGSTAERHFSEGQRLMIGSYHSIQRSLPALASRVHVALYEGCSLRMDAEPSQRPPIRWTALTRPQIKQFVRSGFQATIEHFRH